MAVEDARPGDWLALRLERIVPGGWGWTNAAAVATPVPTRLGLTPDDRVELLWSIDADAGTARCDRGLTVATAPLDLVVTQVANHTWGVHAVLPPDALRRA